MNVHFRSVRAALSFAFCATSPLVFGADRKGEVRVESAGTGDTRDTALLDACRLAVAKVHGTRILGRMAMKDSSGNVAHSSGSKAGEDTTFNSDRKTFAIRDNTAMSFQGLLLRFEVKRENKTGGRWEVEIGADVLDHLPDRFAGKQAVVLPGVNRIEKALSQGALSGMDPGPIAREILKEITSVFANHPQFVILERQSEDLLNEELARASLGNTAVKEQAKLQSEKVADIVAEVQMEPMQVNVENIRFENAPNLFKTTMTLEGHIRLIDVPTKGEICRVPFGVKMAKPFPAAGSAQASVKGAAELVRAGLGQSLRFAKAELLSQLGVSNLVALPDGRLELVGGENLIQPGDTLTLWSKNAVTPLRLGESEVQIEGSYVSLNNTSIRVRTGEVFTYKMRSPEQPVPEATPATPSPARPSLKDRIGF